MFLQGPLNSSKLSLRHYNVEYSEGNTLLRVTEYEFHGYNCAFLFYEMHKLSLQWKGHGIIYVIKQMNLVLSL
jgi:hypothetical protein